MNLLTRREALQALAGLAGASCLLDAQIVSDIPATKLSMPGLYPGRVAGVYNAATLSGGKVNAEAVRASIRKGMADLTDTDGGAAAWKKFFEPGDIVGIKINSNSRHVRSSQEMLREIVAGVNSAGVPNSNIVVYDRYRKSLADAGTESLLPSGVRLSHAAEDYTVDQTGMDGYDPQHYLELPLVNPFHDPKNPAARRSHAAKFITREVTKLINVPVLKDHESAGVTLCLKNLSHGLVNNVNRSHPTPTALACNAFIPAAVSLPAIRNKTVLHILDGTRGIYQNGPEGAPEYVWNACMTYFGTDPVAIDHIGTIVIDEQRASVGLAKVADAFAGVESTIRRQPQHVEFAGLLGLGVYPEKQIVFRGSKL